MLQSLSKSWEIAKESWSLLMKDKKLLVFPAISGVALLLVLASFALPMVLFGAFSRMPFGIAFYLISFGYYFVNALVIIFFNAALVGAVNLRMEGKEPTLADGMRCAWNRVGTILSYACIAATVGVVLRMLRERGGVVGRIAAFFGGLTWAVATYVAVPVLVIEGLGPIDAIRRSSELVKKTWGHQLAGHVGFGIVQGVFAFLVLLVAVPLGVLSLNAGLWPVAIAVAVAAVLTIAFGALLTSALSIIYQTAVYRYAAQGVTSGFEPTLLQA